MAAGATRYFAGAWPPGDVTTMKRGSDQCNGYLPQYVTLAPAV
jgi:hypothetical protein